MAENNAPAPEGQPPVFQHSFVFSASPDIPPYDDAPESAGYIVRHAVNGQESQPHYIPARNHHGGNYAFGVEAPLGSVVTILLMARDEHGNVSKAVPFEFRVSGKRILRHPGSTIAALAMVGCEPVAPEQPVEQPATEQPTLGHLGGGEDAAECNENCGCGEACGEKQG